MIGDLHLLHRLQSENAAIRTLMNTYNLGGWTDALGPMERALRAEAEVVALRKALAESCIEERSQLWEAGPGGGCERALDAERKVEGLRETVALARVMLENGYESGHMVSADAAADLLAQFEAVAMKDAP